MGHELVMAILVPHITKCIHTHTVHIWIKDAVGN